MVEAPCSGGRKIGLLALSAADPNGIVSTLAQRAGGREAYHRALPQIRICGSSTNYRLIAVGRKHPSYPLRRSKAVQTLLLARLERGMGQGVAIFARESRLQELTPGGRKRASLGSYDEKSKVKIPTPSTSRRAGSKIAKSAILGWGTATW